MSTASSDAADPAGCAGDTNIPYRFDLIAGRRYLWCTCGRSVTQPLCDGMSHKGTGKLPTTFRGEADMTAALCGCKRTCRPPYCDGTHVHPVGAVQTCEADAV